MAGKSFASKVFLITKPVRAPLRETLDSFRDSLIPLMMPVIIFGGIFSGVFTATEAASVATVYAFIVSVFLYKEIKWEDLVRILVDTAVMTGVVCLLVGAATAFSWILATQQVPQMLGQFIGSISVGRVVFLLMSIAVFLFFGMILDGLPAILIFFPILFPIALSLGIHPLHFWVLVIAIVGISIVAPPIGLCLVIICSIAKIKLTDTIRPLIPYTLILIPFDRLVEGMLQPEMILETVDLMWEAVNQGVTANVIINNRAGGNAPLIAQMIARKFLQKVEPQKPKGPTEVVVGKVILLPLRPKEHRGSRGLNENPQKSRTNTTRIKLLLQIYNKVLRLKGVQFCLTKAQQFPKSDLKTGIAQP